jgi:hypothetical protein
MAYQAPDATQFKARFPEFSAIGDPLIEALLEEASLFADERWQDADRRVAVLHLAAHAAQQSRLAQLQFGTSSEGSSEEDDESMMYVKTIRFADREVTWDRKSSSSSSKLFVDQTAKAGSPYEATIYGQTYLRLRERNIGGPVTIDGF